MKDISAIREKLGSLKKAPGQNHFEYYVGKFKINIWLNKIQEPTDDNDSENILTYDKVNVDLYEISNRPSSLYKFVYINSDSRFKNYEPIQYFWVAPNRWRRNANGEEMPIHHLCELIKYLDRLSNLNAFM